MNGLPTELSKVEPGQLEQNIEDQAHKQVEVREKGLLHMLVVLGRFHTFLLHRLIPNRVLFSWCLVVFGLSANICSTTPVPPDQKVLPLVVVCLTFIYTGMNQGVKGAWWSHL